MLRDWKTVIAKLGLNPPPRVLISDLLQAPHLPAASFGLATTGSDGETNPHRVRHASRQERSPPHQPVSLQHEAIIEQAAICGRITLLDFKDDRGGIIARGVPAPQPQVALKIA